MTKKCPECGKENPDNSDFCKNCGTDIKSVTSVKKSKSGIAGWWGEQSNIVKGLSVVGVCCLGLILILGISAMLSPDSNTSNTTTSTPTTTTPTPTPVESESEYKASCKSISFDELNKNPNGHAGERVKLTGTVVQIMESYGSTDIRMDVNDNFGDTVYVTYDGTTSALDDDSITIWGEVYGSYTYESQANYQITLPRITAKYITVNTK